MTHLIVPLLLFQPLMKELDEMEKINAKLSAAVEEVTLEHCKKNEVITIFTSFRILQLLLLLFWLTMQL